ncbi:hypothetical protein EPO33_03785 [Patescibacteria group bacterium]|nr:MAG: hypothetical protein EPO33_03785 [Patescibacteria group bacterium]
MTHREPTPDELLSALEGKALPGDAHDAYLRLGRALERAAPPVEEPDVFFAGRLKARLATPMPQPRVPIAALLLPLVGVIAIAAVVFALPRQNPAAPAAAPESATATDASSKIAGLGGELTLVVGDVRWRATATDAWQAASEGAQIAPGAELDVPGNGRAIVTLDDGSAVRLNGKTTLAFSAVTREAVEIRESRGTAYYRVVKDPNRTFTVVTEEGTVTALGTAFAVARDAEKKTLDVNCIESKVKIALAKDGTKLEKELGQGKTLSYDGKKSPDAGTKESAIDPQKIAVVPFFAWNITQDAKEGAPLGIAAEVKELAEAADNGDTEKVALLTEEEQALAAVAPEPKPAPAPVTGITLSGTLSGTTAKLSWKVNGVDVSEGFKVVYAKQSGPTYPGSSASFQGSEVRSAAIGNLPAGNTVYFRVCAYHGGGCSTYSNEVKLVVPAAEPKPVSGDVPLSLSGIVSGTTASVKWTATGDVSGGFKLVWNKTGSPVYPGDNATYIDGGTRASSIKGLPENTAVFIRICRYTGSGCDVYSNQVTLQTGTAPVKATGGYSPISGQQQLSVQQAPNGMQLNWTPSTIPNFIYYKVVRSETNGDPYYPNDGYVTAISNQSTTGYTDTSAISGTTYYYRICAKDGDGIVWCGNVVTITAE